MRWRFFVGLVLAVATACGKSDNGPAAPTTGSVNFRVDGLTCTGSATILFFIDGAQIGSEALAAGNTSTSYTVTSGSHTAGARTSTSSIIWPTGNITVPANGLWTVVLTC